MERTAEHPLDYETLELLRQNHPAWRLLRADYAAFAVSFLHRTFVAANVRTLAQQDLVSRLDDHVFGLREVLGAGAFPRRAVDYLDAWAGDDAGWLRKYYPADADEPHFDLTPAAEKAIGFLSGLQRPAFVATESRLLTVFELLRQIVAGTETSREARLAELKKRRDDLEEQIRRVAGGDIDVMGDTQVKDRFLQMADTARALLGDFRQVEQNFRELDRGVRERIALWEGSKGALLADIFGERDAIGDSDQGKSFHAFWDFLMSPTRQEELSSLLDRVMTLPAVKSMRPDARLSRVHHDWLEAGDVAQRTVARLSEQLRRFLDDQTFQENRRIVQIIRQIEQTALARRDWVPDGMFFEMDEMAPQIELPMDRPLFSPPWKPFVVSEGVEDGRADACTDALFEQVFVDRARLSANIRRALATHAQVTLSDLLRDHPLEHGLSELVTYLAMASESRNNLIDEAIHQTIIWADTKGTFRQALMPLVIFTRGVSS